VKMWISELARVMFVITEDWALITHRLHLVKNAISDGHQIAVVARQSCYRDELQALGVHFYDWTLFRGSLNIFRELRSAWQLKSYIEKFNPELIHAVALKPVIYSGLISKIFKNVQLVAALGGIGFVFTSHKLKARILRGPIRLTLKFILKNPKSNLILQNKDNIKTFEDLGIVESDKTILVKGSGVEIKKFYPSPLPKGIPLVILPARLLRDKGVYEFVEVASRIKSRGFKCRFILVGDVDTDNPESIVIEQIKKWVKLKVVEHWGRIDSMVNVYKQATVVCLPSYAEGLPKALLEAASCGRPLVSFDVPGCREIVKHDFNGKLVQLHDINELENSVTELLLDPKKCQIMGQNGRKLVEAEFSDTLVNSKIFDVWKEMLQSDD